jgi:uncharacterized Zn finger protein
MTITERIKCPACGLEQDAEVRLLWPWPDRTHFCERCGYAIMESEWDKV